MGNDCLTGHELAALYRIRVSRNSWLRRWECGWDCVSCTLPVSGKVGHGFFLIRVVLTGVQVDSVLSGPSTYTALSITFFLLSVWPLNGQKFEQLRGF